MHPCLSGLCDDVCVWWVCVRSTHQRGEAEAEAEAEAEGSHVLPGPARARARARGRLFSEQWSTRMRRGAVFAIFIFGAIARGLSGLAERSERDG